MQVFEADLCIFYPKSINEKCL